MASPTITSLSTTLGPAGQWLYVYGTDFVEGQTQAYFNNLVCEPVAVFNTTSIGFYVSSEATGTGHFKVVTPEGQFTSDILYTVGSPSLPPTITGLREHPNQEVNWTYIDGTNFVGRNTTVTYNGNTIEVFIYTPESGGFKKTDATDEITNITLTTPNGSVQHVCNPPV